MGHNSEDYKLFKVNIEVTAACSGSPTIRSKSAFKVSESFNVSDRIHAELVTLVTADKFTPYALDIKDLVDRVCTDALLNCDRHDAHYSVDLCKDNREFSLRISVSKRLNRLSQLIYFLESLFKRP